MPAEEKDEPRYKRPQSEEDLVSGFEAKKVDEDEHLRLKKIAFLQANGAIGLRMNAVLRMVAKRTKEAQEAENLGTGRLADRARKKSSGLLADARAKLDREIDQTIGRKGLREAWEESDSTAETDWNEIDGLLQGEGEIPASKPAPGGVVAAEPGGNTEESRGVVVSLLAPDVAGDYAVFVALPERLLIVEGQEGDSDLGVLADAVEKRLQAPYRARALRVDERRFVVVAGEIETIDLPGLDGEELVIFALPDGQRTVVLDGARYELASPEVEAILEESAPCLLRLENVDETVWEISLDLL